MISFIDNSTGSPTSWLWDFGDGTTSTEQNPTHVYGAIGGYTVTLTVENAAGNNTTSKYGYVLVDVGSGTDLNELIQHISHASATSGDAPFKVTFHDDRGNGYLNTWNFGDGSQQDCVPDEQHEFPRCRTYVSGAWTIYCDIISAMGCWNI